MTRHKLMAGDEFPSIQVNKLNGEPVTLGQPARGTEWQMVVVYRGRHCPLCTKYLNLLEAQKQALSEIGIDLVAVSGDSQVQLESHLPKLEISYPIYYGLTLEQMKILGLYISIPRSEQETDHRFAEPGMFIVNQEHQLHVVDISNNPFVRPDLEQLVSGLQWIKNPDNHYPVRGTYRE